MGKMWADRLCKLAVAAQKRKDDDEAKVHELKRRRTLRSSMKCELIDARRVHAQDLYEKAIVAEPDHVESLLRLGVLEMKVARQRN